MFYSIYHLHDVVIFRGACDYYFFPFVHANIQAKIYINQTSTSENKTIVSGPFPSSNNDVESVIKFPEKNKYVRVGEYKFDAEMRYYERLFIRTFPCHIKGGVSSRRLNFNVCLNCSLR